MHRYPAYPLRSRVVLDGSWRFVFLGDVDPCAVRPDEVPFSGISGVPGCYDTAGETIGKRGVAVLQTTFSLRPGWSRLVIGGLGLYARIYIDDTPLSEVKMPYATVERMFQATGSAQRLTVVLDNRFSDQRVPLFKPFYDFYGYGGIYRSVWVESLPELAIRRAAVSVQDWRSGRVGVCVGLAGALPHEVRVCYRFDDAPEQEICLPATAHGTGRGEVVEFSALVPAPRPWSPQEPNLHELHIRIGDDAITERFGLRNVRTEGQQILLNDAPLRLQGVNRHEAHPQLGPVQPAHLLADDLRWAQELGANFIRGAHYQQDPQFLEMCDECGMLVWNESLAWGLGDADSQNPATVALLEESTRIMAGACVNNPSVILCGFLNECNADTESGRRLHELLARTVRDCNPNALVSYAGNRFERDISCGAVDVISVNPYPGWISHTEDVSAGYRSQIRAFYEEIAQHFSKPDFVDKPLLVSEAGACGLYGCHDRARAQWSEEFQADYFAEVIDVVHSIPRYCGITLWQFFDCRSFVNYGSIRTKPRGFNCAGLLDEYRRPKLAFDEVKRRFRAE